MTFRITFRNELHWTRRRILRVVAASLLGIPSLAVNSEEARLIASTLVSRPAIKFSLDEQKNGGRKVVTLLHRPAASEPRPVAVIERYESAGRERFQMRHFPSPRSVDPEVDLAALERLYTLAIKLNPEARFCFSQATRSCSSTNTKDAHAEALRQIVRARDGALAKTGRAGVPWRVVSMTPARTSISDAEQASVRVTVGGSALQNIPVFFSQAPHSACSARTDADGVASCRLVDQHGHEEEHDEHHAVVAIFPGDVTAERVLPPTTAIAKAAK